MKMTRLKKTVASTLLIGATVLSPAAYAAANPAAPAPVTASAPTAQAVSLYPLRSLAEAAGGKVTWDAATRTATVSIGNLKASIAIGESTARVGDREVALGAPAQLVDSTTMVPLTFFAEGLGILARYDASLESQFRPAWAAEHEAMARQVSMIADNCAGLAVGVAQEGKPVYLKSFGSRNCEANLPMTVNTVMGVGSSTKTVTAVAIMQLQDAGKLNVNDPVQKYLPEYKTNNPEWAAQTTIHHLLTHSAGLPSMPTLYFMMADSLNADPDTPPNLKQLPAIRTAPELMGFIAGSPQKLIAKPGTYFSYSNESFALLGEIVTRASGQPYAEYVTEQILKPAGMHNSTFSHEAMLKMEEYAELYALAPNAAGTGLEAKHSPVWWESDVATPAGFMRSTVQDMLRFSEIFRTGGLVGETRILSEASVQAMTTGHMDAGDGEFYGYGLFIRPNYHGTKMVLHGGANKGTQALFAILPEKGITAAGLSNYGGAPTDLLVESALSMNAGLPLPAQTPPQPVALAPEELAQLQGVYAGGEAAPFTVVVEEGQLYIEQAGMRLPAVVTGEDQVAMNVGLGWLKLTFLRDESGNIFGLRGGFRILLKQ